MNSLSKFDEDTLRFLFKHLRVGFLNCHFSMLNLTLLYHIRYHQETGQGSEDRDVYFFIRDNQFVYVASSFYYESLARSEGLSYAE